MDMISILSVDGTQPRGMAERDQAVPYESAGTQVKRWLQGARPLTTELQLDLDAIEIAKNRRYQRSRSARPAQAINPSGGRVYGEREDQFPGATTRLAQET